MKIPLTSQMIERWRLAISVYPLQIGMFGMISHPIMSHNAAKLDNGDLVFLKTHEELEAEMWKRFKWIASKETVEEAIIAFNKPYRIAMIDYIIDELTPLQLGRLLSDAWTMVEWPHQHGVQRLVRMFKRAEGLMEDEDLAIYDKLPETIVVYRGLQGPKAKIRGLSWTTEREKAEWFADRWKKITKGQLYTATISKKHVFMYTNSRGEKEVVLNPAALKGVCKL